VGFSEISSDAPDELPRGYRGYVPVSPTPPEEITLDPWEAAPERGESVRISPVQPPVQPDIEALLRTFGLARTEVRDGGFESGELPSWPDETPEPPQPSVVDRFITDLKQSSVETMVWKTFELTADALSPGLSLVVKGARLTAGLLDAAVSFNAGRGADVKIPLIGIGGDYGAHIRIRMFEAEPPPLPCVGLEVGTFTSGASWRDILPDGVPREPGTAATEVAPNIGLDVQALVQLAAERARAAGDHGESWSSFVVAYVDPRSQTGLIVIRSDDRPPYSPLSFEIHAGAAERHLNVVAVADEGPYTCPCCGHTTLSRRGGNETCDECDWHDDGQDDHDADIVRGGPNGPLSLSEARARYIDRGGVRGRHRPPPMPL
jgi:hypothetical protein